MASDDEEDFQDSLKSLIDSMVDDSVSRHKVENILQEEAQNIREERRVYEVFVFECSKPNCEETHTELIDQYDIVCDICDDKPPLQSSWAGDGVEIFQFVCENGNHSTRAHAIDNDDLTCSVHGTSLSLIQSYTTEEGLGTE